MKHNETLEMMEENLWSTILEDINKKRSDTKLPSNKNLLVLGDNTTGKTTLVAKLQGVENPTRGFGLEYAYIDVRDEYREDSTKLGVWVLDGDPAHLHLLKFGLSKDKYPHTLVMLVASMTTPWGLLDQLNYWSERLQQHIHDLNIKPEVERDCKQKCAKRWQEFAETNGDSIKRTSRSLDEDKILTFQDNVFTNNYGVDLVVCITKTDFIPTLEKEHNYKEEHFDFIQYHLRNFCLQHGAALFYTSAKEDKNCDLLYRYLTHRIYGLGAVPPALVVEKDAVLVPAGWDHPNKIAILTESLHYIRPDQPYREVITQPPSIRKSTHHETEIPWVDYQTFLRQIHTLLQDDPRPDMQQQQQQQQQQQPDWKHSSRTSQSALGGGISPSANSMLKLDGKTITPRSEGVLANFFNSLLHKKPAAKGEFSPARNDTHAESADQPVMENAGVSLNDGDGNLLKSPDGTSEC